MEERLRSHYESLSRVIGWTRVADAKAAPILALHTALLGTTAGNSAAIRLVLEDGQTLKAILLGLLLVLFAAFAVAAIVLAARVYMPQTRSSGSSLIYFGSIATMSAADFVAQAKLQDFAQVEDELLAQIHVVSRIANRKMAWVRHAFIASAPALAAWVGAIAFSR